MMVWDEREEKCCLEVVLVNLQAAATEATGREGSHLSNQGRPMSDGHGGALRGSLNNCPTPRDRAARGSLR